MRFPSARSLTVAALALLAIVATGPTRLAAQAPAGIPRTAAGKPDFSGFWQVMNTAAWVFRIMFDVNFVTFLPGTGGHPQTS